MTSGGGTGRTDFLVGLFVLVTLGVLAGALVLTSGILEGRYDLYMRTAEAEGLTQDTRVMLQGLQIGRVREINPRLDPVTNQLSFVATLTIRERFPDGTRLTLPAATRAEIAPPPTLVGPTIIQLVMPSAQAGSDLLAPGDTIDSARRSGAMDALSQIATQLREQLEALLTDTRTLVNRTSETVAATGTLLDDTRPQVQQVLAHLDSNLVRTERILAQVEPRVGPTSDSLIATLGSARQLLTELDSLTAIGQTLALENREAIAAAVRNLSRSAEVLQHFAERVSRRPLRLITGVEPPPDTSTPPDTTKPR